MTRLAFATLSLLALLAPSYTSAQVLTNGNSQLPACASGCTLLNQAAQACGGTTTATQQTWSCFCQSGYLVDLYHSATGICDAACTNPTDNEQISTWYKSNCGTDHGASEHAGDSAATTAVVTSTSTSAGAAAATSSNAVLPSTTATSGTVASDIDESSYTGSWWSSHYKWVIMLIVLFVALLSLGLLGTWLKRHHDRKRDQIRDGFNTGITSRSNTNKNVAHLGPPPEQQHQQHQPADLEPGSGRGSPARTREAFMPYGYGYSRSENRLASREGRIERQRSPLGMEKEVGIGDANSATPDSAAGNKGRRVLVRERDGNEKIG